MGGAFARWGGGGWEAPPNSWVCGPNVMQQFAPPLTPIEGRASLGPHRSVGVLDPNSRGHTKAWEPISKGRTSYVTTGTRAGGYRAQEWVIQKDRTHYVTTGVPRAQEWAKCYLTPAVSGAQGWAMATSQGSPTLSAGGGGGGEIRIGQNGPKCGESKGGAFCPHGASAAFGSHGLLKLVPLATNCWPKAPWGGRGRRGSLRPRTRGVAPRPSPRFGWFPGSRCPLDAGTVQVEQPSDGRERGAPPANKTAHCGEGMQ